MSRSRSPTGGTAIHNPAEQLQTSYDQYRQLWPHLTYVPVGAAYYEGWANWTATPEEVRQFLQKARELNLPAVSFFSWQHARNDPDNPHYPGTELGDAIATFAWPVEVVARACAYLRTQPVAGAVFYRYERAGDQAAFGLNDKPVILGALKNQA